MGLLVTLGVRSAMAFPSSRLVYVRGPGAEQCPDQMTVRDAVKKRLGYDPFFPSSDKTIIARIAADASKLRGEVELVDERGTQVGKREFSAEPDQCDQLVHAMALSISIAIDPKSAESYGQGPKDVPETAEKQPDSQPSSDAEVAPAATMEHTETAEVVPQPKDSVVGDAAPRLWSTGLGATVQFRSTPQVALGATAFAALRTGAWSLAIEGELDAPMTIQLEGVELRSSGGALKLVPCWHWKALAACQVTALRWLAAKGSSSGLGGASGSLALGARLGAELPLSPRFGVLAYADLLLTPLPVSLVSEGRTLWKTPLFGGGVGIAAAVHF